jgi:trehalose-6-phosphatase
VHIFLLNRQHSCAHCEQATALRNAYVKCVLTSVLILCVCVCLHWLMLLQGAFVDAMLERMLALGTPPEFVMAMGDEASDEIMFTGVENFKVHLSKMNLLQ